MLIFEDFLKTQFDQKIHQNVQKMHHIFKILSGDLVYAPEPPSICVQWWYYNCFYMKNNVT